MTDVKAQASRFIEAFNAHDEKALRQLQDPTAVFEAPGGVHLRGAESAAYSTGWIRAFPDAKLHVRNQLVSDPWSIQEVTFEGTHRATLEGPTGTIAATGKTIKVNAVLITRYQNDLAMESRVCFDQVEVLTQLGVMPTLTAATV